MNEDRVQESFPATEIAHLIRTLIKNKYSSSTKVCNSSLMCLMLKLETVSLSSHSKKDILIVLSSSRSHGVGKPAAEFSTQTQSSETHVQFSLQNLTSSFICKVPVLLCNSNISFLFHENNPVEVKQTNLQR